MTDIKDFTIQIEQCSVNHIVLHKCLNMSKHNKCANTVYTQQNNFTNPIFKQIVNTFSFSPGIATVLLFSNIFFLLYFKFYHLFISKIKLIINLFYVIWKRLYFMFIYLL